MGTRIYVITHVYRGIIVDVWAFAKEQDADEYEEKLCKDNDLPWDRAKRRRTESDNDIQQWVLELK